VKALVLGAGAVGTVSALKFVQDAMLEQLVIADAVSARASLLADRLHDPRRVSYRRLDAGDRAAVIDAITVADQPTLGFTQPMPADVANHVAAVAVFGNPSIRLLGSPLTTLSPLYGYKTIDLCNGADPVCSDGNDIPAHSLYVQAGLAAQAAQFAADRIANPQAPISTLAGQG